jgi:hypothetical protein
MAVKPGKRDQGGQRAPGVHACVEVIEACHRFDERTRDEARGGGVLFSGANEGTAATLSVGPQRWLRRGHLRRIFLFIGRNDERVVCAIPAYQMAFRGKRVTGHTCDRLFHSPRVSMRSLVFFVRLPGAQFASVSVMMLRYPGFGLICSIASNCLFACTTPRNVQFPNQTPPPASDALGSPPTTPPSESPSFDGAAQNTSSNPVVLPPLPPAPPQQVGDCGSVQAVENVPLPTGINPVNVKVDPHASGTVYLSTATQGVWKTVDCGAHWTALGRSDGDDDQVVGSGDGWFLYVSPAQKNVIYTANFWGTRGGGGDFNLYRSTDGGATWKALFGPDIAQYITHSFFQWASFDPADPRHMLVTFHWDCTFQSYGNCMGESLDGGDTWKLLKGPTEQWEEAVAPVILHADCGQTPCPPGAISQNWFFNGGPTTRYFFTANAGDDWPSVVAPWPDFTVARDDWTAADGTTYLNTTAGVYCTRDGETWLSTGSPSEGGGTPVTGDGEYVYSMDSGHALFRMNLISKKWQRTDWATSVARAPRFLSLDSTKQLLYMTNYNGSRDDQADLWRLDIRQLAWSDAPL